MLPAGSIGKAPMVKLPPNRDITLAVGLCFMTSIIIPQRPDGANFTSKGAAAFLIDDGKLSFPSLPLYPFFFSPEHQSTFQQSHRTQRSIKLPWSHLLHICYVRQVPCSLVLLVFDMSLETLLSCWPLKAWVSRLTWLSWMDLQPDPAEPFLRSWMELASCCLEG